MPWLEIAISAVVGILLGSLSVMFYYRRGLSAQQKQLQEDALKYEAENALLKESAQKDAEGRKRDLLLQAKEEITNARLELERDVRERKQELAKERNRLDQKDIITASAKPRSSITRPRIMYMMPMRLWSMLQIQSRHRGPHRRNLVMPAMTTRPPRTTAMKVHNTMGSCAMGTASQLRRPSAQWDGERVSEVIGKLIDGCWRRMRRPVRCGIRVRPPPGRRFARCRRPGAGSAPWRAHRRRRPGHQSPSCGACTSFRLRRSG